MRSFSRDAFLSLAAASGLKVHAGRFKCPFDGCRDHKNQDATNVLVTMGKDGCWHLKCWRCEQTGRYVDLFMQLKGLTIEEALLQLRGMAPASPLTPRLRAVPSPPKDDPEKLKPDEVDHYWKHCEEQDDRGETYLAKRGVSDAPLLGLVKFLTEKHPGSKKRSDETWNKKRRDIDKWLREQAKQGRRLAMLMRDVVGVPRGIQVRLAREALTTDKAKMKAVTGSTAAGAFFGRPEMIEASGVVCVTEGMFDTLTVAQWTAKKNGVCVVGAAGKGNLAKLADELKNSGISVDGRIFVLFPQNDRPTNQSRKEFDRLAKLLASEKANIVWFDVPDEFKDISAWFEESFDAPEWPPLKVARAIGLAPDEPGADEVRMVTPLQSVIAIPARFVETMLSQDFKSLCAILDDPALRYGILHRQGSWEWNEMTHSVAFARTNLSDSDWTALRVGLEVVGQNTSSGKPLRWSEEDIVRAVTMLCRRESFHPVREWLNGLKWPGQQLIETTMATAMGLEEYGFEARLLRQWMVSCVARAMKPGCKVDTVPVLVGAQGTMKSTFFRVMGGQWFTDQSIDIHDKDGRMVIHSAWIVEWAELDTMRRSRDAEATKGFITQQVDKFRPPYGRTLLEAPRSCVIVGTTNHEDFLTDPTGNRRFWPIKIHRRIDVARIAELRETLWAEAMAAYVAGDEWHLDASLEEAAEQHVKVFTEGDEWDPLIISWLSDTKQRDAAFVQSKDVLGEAIGKKPDQWNRYDSMRVGASLKRLGWRRTKKRVAGEPEWVYLRPVPSTEELFPQVLPSSENEGTS
jgi:hypothetical protein